MEPEVLEHILDGREKPTNLQLSLLKNITGNFSEELEIGKGGFAKVYKGVLPNGNVVAVKRIMNRHTIDDTLFYREVDSLLAVNHQNIVQFLGYCASTDKTAWPQEGSKAHIYAEVRERLLCFEYVSNGSLQEHITDELRGLEWNARYQIIKGICEGLDYLLNEKHIYHMDLKPLNILLDSNMVPKITDFGQSRYDEKSQTISTNRWGTRGYCPPEYADYGKMSPKSDMYSLGIIIIELVTGDKEILNNNKINVLRRWRHRWKITGKETPLAYQQVTKCIDIGLLCQEIDPTKRPPIRKVICDINEMDSTDGQTRNAYESFSVISPYPQDDMLGTEPLELHFAFELNKQISNSLKLTNPTDAYIAFNIQNMSHLPYCMQPTKGIVPPRSRCSVDVTLDPQGKAPWDMQRANEFIVWSTKVNDGLIARDITANMFSPESGVVDGMNLDVVFYEEESTKESKELIVHMSNIKTDGTVGDVKKSHECLVPTPLRTSSTGSQNPQEAAKGSSETQQASDKTSECTDKLLVLNTIASKDLTPQIVSGEMFINKTDGKVADETKFDDSLSPMMTLWETSTSYKNYQEGESTRNQNYQEGAQAFSEPQSAPDTTTETELIPDSCRILDIHPLELCFFYEQNKLIPCSLDITNNTDEKMAFALKEKSSEEACFVSSWPKFGVMNPRITYTLVLIMDKRWTIPRQRNVDLILHTSTYCESSSDEDTCIQHFQNAEQLGITVHHVTLKCVCALRGVTIFEPIPPSIKIIWMEDFLSINGFMIQSIDANQTEPLIATSFYSGHVHIWNNDTQEHIGSTKMKGGLAGTFLDLFGHSIAVLSVKFIARKGWIVVGTDDGFIRVYNYKSKMQKMTSFKAGGNVQSLAIHPTESYVLSACGTEIKLWDWDRGRSGWKCMQTFHEPANFSRAVAFNPQDHNSFASASSDCTIKVWSLDSAKSKYTLYGHSSPVYSLDFFTRDGQLYLITGSEDKTAKIWDMHKEECAGTLPHNSAVTSVLSHPTLPVLVTGTSHGNVHLWNSINFRLKRILDTGSGSPVKGLACFNESGRMKKNKVVAVGHRIGFIKLFMGCRSDKEQGGDDEK